MVNQKLANYIKKMLSYGYRIDSIKDVILKAGYTESDFNNIVIDNKKQVNWKDITIYSFIVISLTLGFFSFEFISLNISKSVFLDYILLAVISAGFGLVSSYCTRDNRYKIYPYFIPIAVVIDIILNRRINPSIAIPVSLSCYYTLFLKNKIF